MRGATWSSRCSARRIARDSSPHAGGRGVPPLRGVRPGRRRARPRDRRPRGGAWRAARHRAAPRHVRARRTLARRDTSPLRSSRMRWRAARGGRRGRRRAGDRSCAPPRVRGRTMLSARAPTSAGAPASSSPAFEAAGLRDVLEQFKAPVRRPVRHPPDHNPLGRSISAAFTTNAPDRDPIPSPSSSTAATRTPTASSSSRSSAPAESGCSRLSADRMASSSPESD